MKLLHLCCMLLISLSSVLSARILAVLPLPGKSHFIYTQAVMSALAARGHHVTVYSPFTPPSPVPNMKHVVIHTKASTEMQKPWSFDRFKMLIGLESFFGMGSLLVWHISYNVSEDFLAHEKVRELLKSKEKFDLVLGEVLFGEESMLVFGHFFKAPTINLNGFGPWTVINKVHGNALQIASHPDPVSFSFTNRMSFVERLQNFFSTVATMLLYYYDHLPRHQSIINKAFNDPSIPPLEDMVSNISLTLANFHPSVGYSQAIPRNIVPIGGVHVVQEAPPLPKDIKEFLDRGKNSVIYFSLGTVVPVHMMPEEYMKIFVNVFKRLPYKILWKIELDSVPNLPSNVMIAKWLPQQSVLAHPNCVLFITHGGLLSQHEAFHAGVPVVGIPFFGDQPFNVRLYEQLGIGVKLDFNTLTEQSMYQAVISVINKPQFMENAKKVSLMFRHRPMSPTDTAVFWVEYVLRYGNTEHLRPIAAMMPWYQLALLDILAAILAALALVVVVLWKVLAMVGLCGRRKTETVPSKKKKN